MEKSRRAAKGRINNMLRKITFFVAAALVVSLGAGSAEAQKKGGVLKFATPSVRPGLDPAHTRTGDAYMLTGMIFSNLTRIDHELKPQPQLASSWDTNADSSEWTFHLVKNAKFTNGRAVTADDVKFTIDRVLDPKTGSRGAKAIGPIKEVVVKDPHTVVFKLAGPYADLALQLGNTFARIVAKENVPDIGTKPVGSGPFILKEYVPGNKAVLVRNPDYFEKGLPYLDEVHQIYIKEYAAQVSALKTGEIDIMYFAPAEIIPDLKKEPKIDVKVVSAPSFQPLIMWVTEKPFNDVRVRQALRFAVDRQAMMEASTGGLGVLGNDTPVSPSNPYYNKALPQRKRDVAKAKKLLAEAGFPKGVDITLYTSTQRPGLEPAALVAQQSVADAGFRVKIESVDIARLYKDVIPKPKPFAISHNNWFGRPTVDESLSPFYFTGSHWNYTKYSTPEVDKLLDQARAKTDFAERKKLYDKVQDILYNEGPDVVAYFKNYVSAVRKEVKNYKLIPVQYVDLRDTWVER
jgi:peptide/nickel transport system substrate-binding protein